jgi:hypothetical protein
MSDGVQQIVLYDTYCPHQSLAYINEAKWRVTLEPGELAAD